MANPEKYQLLVRGSGEAGKFLAWTMAKEGHRTALVERKWPGGACPNVACLPSKSIIYAPRVASLAKRGAEFGLAMDSLSVNMAAVQTAMLSRSPYTVLRDAIFTHPTVSEGFIALLGNLEAH